MPRYVQYGCGLSCPDDWVNYDASPRLRIERLPALQSILRARRKTLFPSMVRYGDIVKGLPETDGTVRGLYCSHILEHLDRESVVIALRNSLKLLEPGGTFRLVVPCIEWRAKRMIEEINCNDPLAVDRFMQETGLGVSHPAVSLSRRIRVLLGNTAHRWMYDFGLMAWLLEQVGFVDIRRCDFGDAEDRMFDSVEQQGRFFAEGEREVAIESRRSDAPGADTQ